MNKKIGNSVVSLITFGCVCFGQITFDNVSSEKHVDDPGNASGVAFVDYNHDGWDDIYITQGGENVLFKNREGDGPGTPFENVSVEAGVDHSGYGYASAFGDYDNDGWLDIFMTIHGSIPANPNVLYQNQGGNTVTFLDVNNISQIEGATDDAGCAWLDYDQDGWLDIFLVDHHGGGNGYFLWRNEGDGTFTDVTSTAIGVWGAGQCVVPADFDNDGDIDIYTTAFNNDYPESSYFRNNGDGTFMRILHAGGAWNQGEPAQGVTVGDYNNDGWLDLYVVNDSIQGSANRLYRNSGNGLFYEVTNAGVSDPGVGYGAQFTDSDNDGYLGSVPH